MEKNILISAIVKTKNAQETIYETLESIKNFDEIIVIDENSNDDTIEIAKEYKAKIIFLDSTEPNLTYRQSLDEATGEWVFIVEQDEIIPEVLFKEIKKYINNPKKNRYCVAFSQKTFYLNKEIKAARKKQVLRLFKKSYCEFKDKTFEVKLIKGKIHSINSNFKIQNNYILKYQKESILKTFIKQKKSINSKPSVIIKPVFCFIYWYFIKKACLDGIRGYIFAQKKYFRELSKQIACYEKQQKEEL